MRSRTTNSDTIALFVQINRFVAVRLSTHVVCRVLCNQLIEGFI